MEFDLGLLLCKATALGNLGGDREMDAVLGNEGVNTVWLNTSR